MSPGSLKYLTVKQQQTESTETGFLMLCCTPTHEDESHTKSATSESIISQICGLVYKMFLFHMQPKHTNSRRQEQTRGKAQLSINAAFKNCVMMSCCPSENPPRALTHTLTRCFTSCAKVNHTYALKFHLGLERLRRVKSQTKHGCTPTAEHKGHETPVGGTDNELSSVYSKPSKSRTLHMTHENHNGTDQN